ncbi:MAG: glycosyltransferase [Actinomycetes bacterium]
MTSFLQGPHEYFIPTTPQRDADGRGRARTWSWPDNAVEVPLQRLRDLDFDVVVLQRMREMTLLQKWARRRAGVDIPALYVEHNAPHGSGAFADHPLASQSNIPVVHVTHFNQLMWDCGRASTAVVEHGVVDPGYQYSGVLKRAAVVINDPIRRGRAVGSDLLPHFAMAAPLDVFGMNVSGLQHSPAGRQGVLRTFEDLPQDRMHRTMSHCRAYVHTTRSTSLGLSLIEAMHLGMPVVALGTTEAPRAVPALAGVVSTRVDDLVSALQSYIADRDLATAVGQRAREWAIERYGLKTVLANWNTLLGHAVCG